MLNNQMVVFVGLLLKLDETSPTLPGKMWYSLGWLGLGGFRGGSVIEWAHSRTRTVRQIPGGPGTWSLALARAENNDFNHCSLL